MANELYRVPTGGSRAAGVAPTVVVGCISLFFLTLWAGTQTVAHMWNYAPVLGHPMSTPSPLYAPTLFSLAIGAALLTCALMSHRVTRGWAVPVGFLALYCYALSAFPVYAPWQVFIWWARYHWSPQSAPVWAAATKAMAIVSLVGLPLIIAASIHKAKKIGGKSDLYGSADFGTEQQLRGAGLLSGKGLYVGAWATRRFGREELVAIQDDGPAPVLGIAPNRTGKGVGFAIPNALTWGESMVVLDPKGENWDNSAGYRKQQGHLCIKVDPTCNDDTVARWNPILEMPEPPYDVAFAQTMAQALMEDEEFTKQDATALHFRSTGENFLRGVILHVWYAEANKSLEGCLHLLANPLRDLASTLERMRTAEHDPDGKYHWVDTEGRPTKTHPTVAAAARAVENQAPNERTGTISTAVSFFNLYQDPIVAQNTKESDFSVRDLIDPELPPMAIYLTIPPPEMGRLKPFVRLLFYQILHYLTAELRDPSQGWVERGADGKRVLLLMDEFPILGNMRLFHSTISVMASYGIKVLLLAQDITQIHRAYGKEESITGNCRIQVAFAPNRNETAEWISEKTGVRTILKQTRTYTGNRFAMYLPHLISSEQEVKRELVTPDEAMRLPESMQLLFANGIPFLTRKIVHYRDQELLRRSQIPAPEVSDRIDRRGVILLKKEEPQESGWLEEVQA